MLLRQIALRSAFFILFTLVPIAVQGEAAKDSSENNGWNFPDFAGTQAIVSGHEMTSKIFLSGSAVRVEQSPALSELFATPSLKVYKLTKYPDGSHQCVVMKRDQAKMLPSPIEVLLSGRNVKRTTAGTEVVEGHPCKVETVVLTRPDGKPVQAKVWEASDLQGLAVKIEMESDFGKLRAIYRDVVIGAPEAALFTVPDKCTPIEKMGQVAEHKTIK